MDFSIEYYRDEVRNGFYIPTAIKQAWAANLAVLSEIDRICTKYNIIYFADWGSMLGAVRHGGYVPWDDDLDICMKRADYNRFREVADKELPGEFAIHDFRRKEGHWLFLSRVVNCNHISFDEKHLDKYHNFPYIAVVDIFVKDYLYRDSEKRRKHCEEIKRIIAVADGIVDGSFAPQVVENELTSIEQKYDIYVSRKLTPREIGIQLYDLAEKVMGEVPEDEADEIGQIFPMVLQGGVGLPKEYYDKTIRLPFENTTIPVPATYDIMLRNRYGNYLEIKKIWTGHDYPYFEKQRDNLQAVADFSLPEFTFNSEMLDEVDRTDNKNSSIKGLSEEFVSGLNDITMQLINLLKNGEFAAVLDILPDCQQYAVDYGTLVEKVKGEEREGCVNVVAAIQGYCDCLYNIYVYFTEETIEVNDAETDDKSNALANAFDILRKEINRNVIDRKEVLFLPIGAREWKSFEKLYKDYSENGEYDIYVVPMPVFFKDIYGRVAIKDDELRTISCAEDYPDDVIITSWKDYDVNVHNPSVIYIQNPYDGENPCLTLPPQFYAKTIRQYTDKLVYIPPYVVGEFSQRDYPDVYNMKHYVTAPGVIYADEILVQSENIKQRYIEKLTDFAGKDTKGIWETKIKISKDCYYKEETKKENKKRILYCIGINEIEEHEDIMLGLENKLLVFSDNKESVDVDIVLFPNDRDLWDREDDKTRSEFLQRVKDFAKQNDSVIYDGLDVDYEGFVDSYDAYYGSASPFVPAFYMKKKPVMIANYDVL